MYFESEHEKAEFLSTLEMLEGLAEVAIDGHYLSPRSQGLVILKGVIREVREAKCVSPKLSEQGAEPIEWQLDSPKIRRAPEQDEWPDFVKFNFEVIVRPVPPKESGLDSPGTRAGESG